MRSFAPKDIGLKSDSFVSDLPNEPLRRVIANVEGFQKEGKTDFCCRFTPDPIVLFNFDQGVEGVVDKLRVEGRRIIVAGAPQKSRNGKKLYPTYHFARPVPERGEGRKSEGYLERVKKLARPLWERFISDYTEFLESDARTGVVDTGGGAFALGKFAFVGMDKTSAKDDPYGQKSGDLKSIFQGLVTEAYSYDKNVLWIHRLKEEWKGGAPSGQYKADGYNQIAYEVQMSIRLKYNRRKEERTAEVRDLRIGDPDMSGEIFAGKQCRFSTIMAMVTGTDQEDWE